MVRVHEVETDMVWIDLEYILDRNRCGYEEKGNFELGGFVCF